MRVAVTLPEKPALHAQPLGTLMPVELSGHCTASQLKVAGKAAEPEAQPVVEEDLGEKPGIQKVDTERPLLLAGQPPALVAPLVMQLPSESANKPRAAHVAMASKRATMETLLFCSPAMARVACASEPWVWVRDDWV